MKVVNKGTAANGLRAGDTLTISISHNMLIDGDEAWVKYEGTTVVGEEETDAEAHERLKGFVNEKLMDTIYTTVETVEAEKAKQA